MKDALTNLHSSKALYESLLTCKHPKLFLIDIKNFKQINLTHSDEGGDFILRSFASSLSHFAKEHEMQLFRFKNDQFILFQDRAFELSSMEKLIFSLLDLLKGQSYTYEGRLINLSFHIGISFDHTKILEKAQKALHVAKVENQPFVTYSEFANSLMNESEEKIANTINDALQKEQIVLHFQAIQDCEHKVVYYESLLRLECYNGLQSPKLFLKLSREKNFYDTLLTATLRRIKALLNSVHYPLALNLSSMDLKKPERIAFLCEELSHNPIMIELQCEIEEDYTHTIEAIKQFHAAGIRVILDNVEDASLLELFTPSHIAYVKVHGDIIRNLGLDEHVRAKALAILEASKRLNAPCIATHLNSEKAYEVSQTLGFTLFQGYRIELPHAF